MLAVPVKKWIYKYTSSFMCSKCYYSCYLQECIQKYKDVYKKDSVNKLASKDHFSIQAHTTSKKNNGVLF